MVNMVLLKIWRNGMKMLFLIGALIVFLITICVTPFFSMGRTEQLSNPSSPVADHPVYIPILVGNDPVPANTPFPTPNPTTAPIPTSTPGPSPTPVPRTGNAIIADDTVIPSFTNIPASALQSAAGLKTLFMHQSTGDLIAYEGLGCLAGLRDDPSYYPPECLTYAQHPYNPYDDRNWNWKMWDEPMADAIAKTDQWVTVVNSQQQNYQVLGMKFCYVDGWNQDFDYYRSKMEQLEAAYPDKIFIWSTSALWSQSTMDSDPGLSISIDNINTFNQQLRAYAAANDKILYDIAAIESHDTNGNLCQSNGYEALCDDYYDSGGGHPNATGSIRLAKGFWWLMSRVGGWNGAIQAK
jgi:hypothetical protein